MTFITYYVDKMSVNLIKKKYHVVYGYAKKRLLNVYNLKKIVELIFKIYSNMISIRFLKMLKLIIRCKICPQLCITFQTSKKRSES